MSFKNPYSPECEECGCEIDYMKGFYHYDSQEDNGDLCLSCAEDYKNL